jgi:PAS domain S-box-containing protein
MAHEQAELAMDSMVAIVTRCSRDFRYVWVTSSYAAWVGRPPEDIAGRALPDVIGSQGYETIRPYIERVLSGRKVEHTTRLNLPGRGYRWIHAVYVPIYSRGVNVDGWISTVMDVTENDRIEQERGETEAEAQPLASERTLRRRAPEFARGVRARLRPLSHTRSISRSRPCSRTPRPVCSG